MNISREEFSGRMEEGQNLLLGFLADSSEVSVEQFYKIANVMQYFTLFSGVIYNCISIASNYKSDESQYINKAR